MARGSVGRKVARAARTGGGRSRRGRSQTPFGYYATLVIVVLLGLATIAFSRYQVTHKPAAVPPTLQDHWHSAFAFDICGKLLPNPPQNPNVAKAGIHTHGDGLIHVEPLSSADTGHNATLGRFVHLYPGMELTATSVRYPGKKTWRNGERCGTKAAKVQVEVWSSLAATHGHIVTGNPDDVLLENGQLITIAFVPPGTSIPKPPSAANLLTVNSAPNNPSRPTTATTKPGSKKATSKGSTSTTAKAGTSTTATTSHP
ncbi:MAG: hypothetical protein ACRD0L_02525 [Acidimicrobiales bacterium]